MSGEWVISGCLSGGSGPRDTRVTVVWAERGRGRKWKGSTGVPTRESRDQSGRVTQVGHPRRVRCMTQGFTGETGTTRQDGPDGWPGGVKSLWGRRDRTYLGGQGGVERTGTCKGTWTSNVYRHGILATPGVTRHTSTYSVERDPAEVHRKSKDEDL